MTEKRLYLIDTFALIFRAYYANMRIKNGAAYTMARMLLALVNQHNPTHLACVFDRPEPTFRHEIYPEYKANRAEMPEDLRPQIPLIRDLVQALNIPIVELAGFEADFWWMSPPCQPYTLRGLRRDLQDPRAGSLIRILDVLEETPAAALPGGLALENVSGFADSEARRLQASLKLR